MWKRIAHGIVGAVFLLIIMALRQGADAADYVVDSGRSELAVRLFKGGIASAFAHDHVIYATEFSGKGIFEPGNASNASLSVEIKADSLRADDPFMRQKYGLTKAVSDKDRAKIQATMESAEQMDVSRYPTMKFRSTSVKKQSQGQYVITGELTIHGVTQIVSFPASVTEKHNGTLRGKASLRFKQSDFGIEPYSALFGAVRNEDEAVLYLDIVARPASMP